MFIADRSMAPSRTTSAKRSGIAASSSAARRVMRAMAWVILTKSSIVRNLRSLKLWVALHRVLRAARSCRGAGDALSTLDAKISDDPNGVFGEAAVSAIVARVAHDNGRRHCLLQNVYIPTHAGYTEIDTVLLHESGIYVFETKNVSGEVSGDLEQERWKLYLNERTQHTLYNPLKQNQGHIGALLRQLRTSYSRARVYSFVVFSDRCVLRRVPASGNRFQVIHFGELKQALANVLKHSTNVHGKKQLDEWTAALQPCVNVSEAVKQSHRESVQKLHGN